MTKLFKPLLFVGSGLCAAFILFEVFLRLTAFFPTWKSLPVAEVSLYGVDAQTSFTHRPNLNGVWITENRTKVSTNNFGIRSNGISDVSLQSGSFKIGLIGDSITEALQVSDNKTFSALLEKNLKEQGYDAQVFNLGLAGATPSVEAQRVKKYTQTLQLDHVIIIEDPYSLAKTLNASQGATLPYYKANGIESVTLEKPYLQSNSYKFKKSSLGQIFYSLIDHSHVLTLINNRLNRGLFEELQQQVTPTKKVKNQKKCDEESLSVLADIDRVENNVTKKLLSYFLEDIKKTNVPITVALYNTWNDCDLSLEVNAAKKLNGLLRANNIKFFNLKNALQKNLTTEELKDLRGFKNNKGYGHLNEHGHEVFAKALEGHIKTVITK